MKTIINNDNKVEDRWEVDTEVPCQEETSGRNTRTKRINPFASFVLVLVLIYVLLLPMTEYTSEQFHIVSLPLSILSPTCTVPYAYFNMPAKQKAS